MSLNELAATTQNIGGNGTIVKAIDENITPVLQSVESLIDKIGSDFTVGSVASQTDDIQQILNALDASTEAISGLRGANGALAASVTALTDTAVANMQLLVDSARAAAAPSENIIPDEVFTDFPGPGTACV